VALGKLGSLVTTNPKPVGIFTATNSQTVTVYVNNQNNVNAKYSIGVSTDASTIQDSEYVNKLNPIGPLEVLEVDKLYVDVDQTLVVQSSVSGVSFSAIAVGSGSTEGTGYGRTDTLIVTDSTKGKNQTLFNPSEDVICTVATNNQSYESGKIYVGVADSSGNLNNGWIIFAQRIVPGGNFSIKDLYIGANQSVVVKSDVADVSFTTLAVNLSGGGGGGGGPSSLDATLGVGNSTDKGMSVGVVTATQIRVGTTTFTEDLVVSGDARVTGILTVGTASITIDGTENQVNVGTGVTIHHSNGVLVGENALHSTGLTVNNLTVAGVLTATVTGDATGLTGTPDITVNNVVAAGIVTAIRFVGDGSSLTGVTTAGSVGGTPLNTPNTLVQRDESGGFSAGIVSTTSVTADTVIASGAITAASFVGSGSSLTNIIPSGIIVMWSGTTIPTGWLLCDGSNSTPDLRNRFIVGADNNSKTGITTQAGPTFDSSTGARDSVYNPGDVGGETAHQLTVDELASHTHSRGAIYPGGGPEQNQSGSREDSTTFNVQTGSAGGDNYHENRPPYYALAFIMKA